MASLSAGAASRVSYQDVREYLKHRGWTWTSPGTVDTRTMQQSLLLCCS